MTTNPARPTWRAGEVEPLRTSPAPLGPTPVPRPPAGKPKRPWWPLFLFGVIVGAGVYYWNGVLSSAPSASTTAATLTAVVEQTTFVRPLRLTGTVSARDSAAMRAPRLRVRSQLTLTELAAPGSFVKAGEVVARFESREMADRVADMKSNRIQARAKLDREKAKISIERQTLRQQRDEAKAEYDKAVFDLRKTEVLSEIESELLRNAADQAKATWGQLEQEVKLQEEVFRRRIRIEELEVADADLRYERYARDLEETTVRTPVVGLVVLEPMYKGGGQFQQAAVGDQVYPGAVFMRVVDLSGLVVSAAVNQVDAQRVEMGQPAEIHFDAYPNLVVEGRVASVGAIAQEGRGGFGFRGGTGLQVKTIPVEIAFQTEDSRVIPDLSAAVDVTLGRKEDVLIAPRAAIERRGEEAFVRVRERSSWSQRKVETGASNAVETVVLAGLEAGDEIALQNRDQP